MRTLLFLLAIANAGCLRDTQFQCATDTACGAGGVCEASGFCSVADPDCGSGRRYSDSAGSRAGQCTDGGGTTDDGGVTTDDGGGTPDGSMPPPDGSVSVGCPSGYVELAGLANGHLYRVVAIARNWTNAQADCKLTTQSAYLAVPDDAAELMALDAAAGVARYWVGITDSATEMTWLTVNGGAQTYLPWQAPAPDDLNPGEDCVEALSATHTINDQRCNTALPAICECVP